MLTPGLKDTLNGVTNIQIVDDFGIPINPATETLQTVQNETLINLRRIVKLLESSAVVDIQNRQKVTIDGITNGLGALLGVAVLGSSSGANIPTTNYPTAAAPIQQPGTSSWQPVWIGPVDQRYQIMDNARLVYDQGIRSHLVFS